jgi:hypothetical protein
MEQWRHDDYLLDLDVSRLVRVILEVRVLRQSLIDVSVKESIELFILRDWLGDVLTEEKLKG